MNGRQAPVLVMNHNQKREAGSKAQLTNILAARAVSDIVRSTLGPKSMLKMLIDPMGGIVITNDGHCILRELDVSHPAAKSMIDIARTQDENVGDGTTSVIVLTGALLKAAEPLLLSSTHQSSFSNHSGFQPVTIVHAFYKALHSILKHLQQQPATESSFLAPIMRKVDTSDTQKLIEVVSDSLGTKNATMGDDLAEKLVRLAVEAAQIVSDVNALTGTVDVDIKRYIRIEKVPGGSFDDLRLVRGVVLNKDVTHPRMKRKIVNPRVLLLDCPLEYKKLESSAQVELGADDADFDALLRQEEEYLRKMCAEIIKHKPDLVITEKGVSDLAQHFLMKAGITCLRRARKTDNNRIARCLGVRIVSDVREITSENISQEDACELFEVRKIGDEYFSYLEGCNKGKACTLLLRGGSKDILNEIERNIHDLLQVTRNVLREGSVVAGAGCFEMRVATLLANEAKEKESGVERETFEAIAKAFEDIPVQLLKNAGADVVRKMVELRALHAQETEARWGVDGETGDIVQTKVFEAVSVKKQMVKTAFEAAAMILRVDDIISGISKGKSKK